MREDASATRREVLALAGELREREIFLLFSHEARFLNPLVERERVALESCSALDEPDVVEVIEILIRDNQHAPKGVYFPIPMTRRLAAGDRPEQVLASFYYDLIRIKEDQSWWHRGRPVAPKIKEHFLRYLGWEPQLERWFFEFRVNEGWWDKSYLDARITPVLLSAVAWREGAATGTLNVAEDDVVDFDTLRLDHQERLFCQSARFGEVLFSEALRFSVLRTADQDLRTVEADGRLFSLRWPDDKRPQNDEESSDDE